MRPARSQCMSYADATAALGWLWDEWAEAQALLVSARKAYTSAADAQHIALCNRCAKPMPDHDSSNECDGCYLGWGWDTPQGRRDRRAEQLDSEIERLRAERVKL